MKRGRWLWAAALCLVSVMVLAGYTEAGARRAVQETPVLALPRPEDEGETPPPETEVAPAPWTPPEDALRLVARDELGRGGVWTLYDDGGTALCRVAPDARGELALEIAPGAYRLTAADGRSVRFRLRENASVDETAGDGWTDGELLHLDDRPRCALRLTGGGATPVIYTLTGGDYAESRTLTDDPEQPPVRFTGLAPGTYTLRGSDGSSRAVTLTEQQAELTVGVN